MENHAWINFSLLDDKILFLSMKTEIYYLNNFWKDSIMRYFMQYLVKLGWLLNKGRSKNF